MCERDVVYCFCEVCEGLKSLHGTVAILLENYLVMAAHAAGSGCVFNNIQEPRALSRYHSR